MKRIGSLTLAALLGVAVWYAGPGLRGTPQQAFAQAVGCVGAGCYEAYKVSYFDVATAFKATPGGYGGANNSGGSGDALLRIVNAGNWESDAAEGRVCANIYVYNDTQEQQECCSCPLTANALAIMSVTNNLTSNPFNTTMEGLAAGVIKIVGSGWAGGCSNSPVATTAAGVTPVGTTFTIAGGLHEWLNHTETMYSNMGPLTSSTSVEEFTNASLDTGELGFLQAGCKAINGANKSGSMAIGICKCPVPG